MASSRWRIRHIVLLCSLLSASWLAFTPRLARASCALVPLSELKAGADVIVRGQVATTSGRDARVVVQTYHKGRGPHELSVTGRNSDDPGMQTSVDFTFKEGQSYLLFLTGSPPGLLRTNECAGNREGATALTPEELAVLGPGAPPDLAIPDPTPIPADGVGNSVQGAPVNDGRSSSTEGTAAFLLLPGILLGGCLLFIVMRRRRRGH